MAGASVRYVTRLSAAALRNLVADLALEKQLELGAQQRLMELTHAGKRYVIAGGPWRQQRDQERRHRRLAKADLILQEAQQDGWYLLHTNEAAAACPTERVLSHYKGLLDG